MAEEMALTVPASVLRWCRVGSRGLSSESIVEYLTGLPLRGNLPLHGNRYDHPYDPDDLTRCVRLLEACPELAERFPEMAGASPEWARLVGVWGELVALLDEESPGWRSTRHGSAPRCYAAMKRALYPGRIDV